MMIEISQWILDSGKAVWGFLSSLECVTVLALLCVSVIVMVISIRRSQIKSVSLSLPFKLGSVVFDTTPTDRIIAWKAYVQLVTRKAALPFDEEHDSIEDVYASLYSLFDMTRDLLSDLPPKTFQKPSRLSTLLSRVFLAPKTSQKPDELSTLLLRILNDGLRPHLTRWQSDFRTWIGNARKKDEFMSMSPVGLQKRYPRYSSLVENLKDTNTQLSELADGLYLIARGKSPRTLEQPKVKPEAPQNSKIEERG